MQTADASAPFADPCDLGDRDRRGVGRDQAVRPDRRFEVAKESVFDIEIFKDGFYDSITGGQCADVLGDL